MMQEQIEKKVRNIRQMKTAMDVRLRQQKGPSFQNPDLQLRQISSMKIRGSFALRGEVIAELPEKYRRTLLSMPRRQREQILSEIERKVDRKIQSGAMARTAARLDVTESDNTVSVHYSYALRQMELPKFSVLNEQLLVLNLMRAGAGEHILPLLVESPFAYEEDTQRAFLTRNNVMWQFLEPGLESQLAKMDSDRTFAGYVQQALFSAIPAGAFQTEDIAKRLGVSVRTLQRNLTAEGTTFQQQVQEVQKAMAFSYLKMNLTTEEIASLLGYNEVNSFVRAFGKWTGTTITEYRRDTKQ